MPIPAEAVGGFPGVVNTGGWTPDPDDVAAQLLNVADYLDDLSAPLRASSRILQNDIKERFDTETDPEGNPWRTLSWWYLKWKEESGAPGQTKLSLWGLLEKSATAGSAFVIDAADGSIFYSAANLPDYWVAHQFGVEADEYTTEQLLDPEFDIPSSKGGKKNIPARPFIGVSDEAEAAVFDAFDLWFFEGTSGVFVGKSGVMQTRGAGGRFGSRINF